MCVCRLSAQFLNYNLQPVIEFSKLGCYKKLRDTGQKMYQKNNFSWGTPRAHGLVLNFVEVFEKNKITF